MAPLRRRPGHRQRGTPFNPWDDEPVAVQAVREVLPGETQGDRRGGRIGNAAEQGAQLGVERLNQRSGIVGRPARTSASVARGAAPSITTSYPLGGPLTRTARTGYPASTLSRPSRAVKAWTISDSPPSSVTKGEPPGPSPLCRRHEPSSAHTMLPAWRSISGKRGKVAWMLRLSASPA